MKRFLLVPAIFGVWLCLSAISCVAMGSWGYFTGYANLEKLYTLEDELIAITDLILNMEKVQHEGSDIHGIFDLGSVVDNAKDIHRQIINRNMTAYITHPVNILHMTKRLVRDWGKVVETLDNSKACDKIMKVKVQNIADNIPTEANLGTVIKSFVRLQALHNLSADSIMSGDVMGQSALSPLSLDDVFEIARGAYEAEEYKQAVDWLKVFISKYEDSNTTFSLSGAHSLLSSSYLMLKKPTDALNSLEEILKIDPDNANAKRNKRYVEGKIKDQEKGVNIGKRRSKKDLLIQRYCQGNYEKNETRQSRLFCTYLGDRDQFVFSRPAVQAEVLSIKPLIVLLHNVTSPSEQKAVSHLGLKKMRSMMIKDAYRNPDGIDSTFVVDKTIHQWIPRLEERLKNIKLSRVSPDRGQFMIRNIGMEGHTGSKISRDRNYRLGTYLVFLSLGQHGGGEVVFPYAKAAVVPEQGSVLFYETSANHQTTICPVAADTMWVGLYPLTRKLKDDICYDDFLLRPKARR